MAEVISEAQPRIKFAMQRTGSFDLGAAVDLGGACSSGRSGGGGGGDQLAALCALMGRVEAAGAAPVLCDGKVGGNCAVARSLLLPGDGDAGASSSGGGDGGAGGSGGDRTGGDAPSSSPLSSSSCVFVSRSGKAAGAALRPRDFVRVSAFARKRWRTEF